MQLRTTSTQRTYRYVRLSLVAVIVFLGVGVGVQIASDGPLVSLSAAFYTPARDVFVGALCAVALALLVLSGRSIEQALFDIAAVFAPVIALVPSPVGGAAVGGDTGLECPGERSCVPDAYLPGISVGVTTLFVVGLLVVLAAAVLAAVQRTMSRALVLELAVVAVIGVAMAGWWMLSPETFVLGAHDVSAAAFFALVAAVAAIAAFRPTASSTRRHRVLRVAYGAVALGILAAMAAIVAVVVGRALGADLADSAPASLVFWGEALALALFAVFWLIQTIELWDEPDPTLLPAT